MPIQDIFCQWIYQYVKVSRNMNVGNGIQISFQKMYPQIMMKQYKAPHK